MTTWKLPPIKPVTTRINLDRANCLRQDHHRRAARRHAARLPFGPSTVALVAYLNGCCQMVGYARLAEMLEDSRPEDFRRRDRQHARTRTRAVR
jgi:hypothetical protein